MPRYLNRVRHITPTPLPEPVTFDTGMSYTDYTVTGGITTIAGLQTYVDSVPDGASSTSHSRILLGAGRTYTGATGLDLNNRNHLTFEGGGTESTYGHTGGASIVCTGDGTNINTSPIRASSGGTGAASDLRFHALTVEGSSTVYATTGAYVAGRENQHGFAFFGTATALIDHCLMQKVMGDGVYASDRNVGSGTWSSNITTQYCDIKNNGRMGIAIIACNTFTVKNTRFTDIALVPFDFEPNNASEGGSNIEFNGNLIAGNWSWSTAYNDPLWMTAGSSSASLTGYYRIINNTVTGSKYDNLGAPWIGPFHLTFGPSVKAATLTISNNTCSAPTAGYIGLIGGWTNGGSVTNNTGFWNGSGTYFSTFESPNGSITYSNNT
jgi:hypothetical protein